MWFKLCAQLRARGANLPTHEKYKTRPHLSTHPQDRHSQTEWALSPWGVHVSSAAR